MRIQGNYSLVCIHMRSSFDFVRVPLHEPGLDVTPGLLSSTAASSTGARSLSPKGSLVVCLSSRTDKVAFLEKLTLRISAWRGNSFHRGSPIICTPDTAVKSLQ